MNVDHTTNSAACFREHSHHSLGLVRGSLSFLIGLAAIFGISELRLLLLLDVGSLSHLFDSQHCQQGW